MVRLLVMKFPNEKFGIFARIGDVIDNLGFISHETYSAAANLDENQMEAWIRLHREIGKVDNYIIDFSVIEMGYC